MFDYNTAMAMRKHTYNIIITVCSILVKTLGVTVI